jgi:hypothetical protein
MRKTTRNTLALAAVAASTTLIVGTLGVGGSAYAVGSPGCQQDVCPSTSASASSDPTSTESPKPGLDTSVPAPPDASSSPAPTSAASGPQTVSGKFTNAAGAPLGNLTVTLSASDAITDTSSDATLPVVGTVTTAADGSWSFTLPSVLPAGLQSIADANDGVLNLSATANGQTSDGLTMTATDNLSAATATGAAATSSSLALLADNPPHTAVLHVADLTDHSNLAADSAGTSTSEAVLNSADPSGDTAPLPAYQSSTGENLANYNPDLVNGVDHSAAVPLDNPCKVTYSTISTSIAYTTVGEAHANYDTTATFDYSDKMATTFGISESQSGKGWSIQGSTTIANSIGHSTGFAGKGPYWAYQWRVPINYAKLKGTVSCVHSPTSYFYEVKALGYKVPSGGYVGTYGKNVSQYDSVAYYKSPTSWRAKIYPGTSFGLVSGRTVNYSVAASVFGVGLSAQTSYDANHTQRITAGKGKYEHDIWGMKGPVYGNPGGFYSF